MVKVDGTEVKEGLYYTKDFEWAKIEGDKVRLGITDYAQKQLREIVYAELPSPGTNLTQILLMVQLNQSKPYLTSSRQ